MQEYVKAAQTGDVAAWTILYRQHEPWLYAAALRICENHDDARDAVQDTFLQAYLNIHQLHDPAKFYGWLKTTLMRTCYRYRNASSLIRNASVPEGGTAANDEINSRWDKYAEQMKIYHSLGC